MFVPAQQQSTYAPVVIIDSDEENDARNGNFRPLSLPLEVNLQKPPVVIIDSDDDKDDDDMQEESDELSDTHFDVLGNIWSEMTVALEYSKIDMAAATDRKYRNPFLKRHPATSSSEYELTPGGSQISEDLREIQKTVQNYGNRLHPVPT